MTPTVLLSFIIFCILAYRFGYRQSITALDSKIDAIRQSLDEARQAKEMAIHDLNTERRRYGEILNEMDLTLKRAEEQALSIRHETLKDLDSLLKKRREETDLIIRRLRQEAIAKIQEEAITLTVMTFEALATTKFSNLQHETLNEEAIARIATQIKGDDCVAERRPKKLPRPSRPLAARS
jgi:F-type H+-transporting ATPase subunit b